MDKAFMAFDGKIINLKVVGTLSSESELVSSDLVLVNCDDFRKLFGIDSKFVTEFHCIAAKMRSCLSAYINKY
ncbi:MAG: hypothetical protein ACXV7F_06450 [Methylomonas sp.]